jgi:hypothetical protein
MIEFATDEFSPTETSLFRPHVSTIFRVVFDSSHFLLQVANLVDGQKSPLRWVSVADPSNRDLVELPAHLVLDLNTRLPNGANLIRRSIVEEREVVLTFTSRAQAVAHATDVLGLTPQDEANSGMNLPCETPPRWWSRFSPQKL